MFSHSSLLLLLRISGFVGFLVQVRVTTIWHCTPLSEHEFGDAIRDNYFTARKFKFGLSEDQVCSYLLQNYIDGMLTMVLQRFLSRPISFLCRF